MSSVNVTRHPQENIITSKREAGHAPEISTIPKERSSPSNKSKPLSQVIDLNDKTPTRQNFAQQEDTASEKKITVTEGTKVTN